MKANMPAYMEIYNDLYLKIIGGEYKDGEQIQTEPELCKKYYVSRITIQKALSMLVEKGLITRISGKGSFVNTVPKVEQMEKKEFIAFVLSDFSASYGMGMLKSVEKSLAKYGYHMIFRNSDNNKEIESEILSELSSIPLVKGIIIQPVFNEYFNTELIKISLRKYPLVLIDRNLEGLTIPFVGTDNRAIVEKTIDYLLERGHENIAFVSPDAKNNSSLKERFKAFCDACNQHGVMVRQENHLFLDGTDREENIARIAEYLRENPQITCLFTAQYDISREVGEAIASMGKSIPSDYSVVTFDNIAEAESAKTVDYIRQNETEIGARAVEVLIRRFAEENLNEKIYISADLVVNGSVKAIAKQSG